MRRITAVRQPARVIAIREADTWLALVEVQPCVVLRLPVNHATAAWQASCNAARQASAQSARFDARGESRTRTGLPPADFESAASAIPPLGRAKKLGVTPRH